MNRASFFTISFIAGMIIAMSGIVLMPDFRPYKATGGNGMLYQQPYMLAILCGLGAYMAVAHVTCRVLLKMQVQSNWYITAAICCAGVVMVAVIYFGQYAFMRLGNTIGSPVIYQITMLSCLMIAYFSVPVAGINVFAYYTNWIR